MRSTTERPDTPPAPPPDSDDPEAPRPRFGCCLQLFAWVGLGFALLVLGGPVLIQYFIRRNLPPTEIAQLDAARSERLHTPPEWFEPRPAPLDMIRAVQDFNHAFAAIRGGIRELETGQGSDAFQRLRTGQTLAPDEVTSISDILTTSATVLQKAEELVNRPDYSFSEYFAFQTAAKLLIAKAILTARDGNCFEALALASLPIRLSRTDQPAILIEQLIAVAVQSMGSDAYSVIIDLCADEPALRDTLADLNKRIPEVIITTNSMTFGYENLAQLLRFKRNGYPIDIHPNATGAHYYRESFIAQIDAPQYILGQLPFGDPRREYYGAHSRPHSSIERNKAALLATYHFAPDMLLRIGMPNIDEARTRALVATTKLELLRLRIAQRIAQLQGREPARAAAAYVPEYLPEEPMDPFSGKPFPWSEKHQRFYSIGPDAHDDKLAMPFDSTRGTFSHGDVTLPALP